MWQHYPTYLNYKREDIMKKLRVPDKIEINLLFPIITILALFLGFTGRVNWWAIVLIYLSQFTLKLRIK